MCTYLNLTVELLSLTFSDFLKFDSIIFSNSTVFEINFNFPNQKFMNLLTLIKRKTPKGACHSSFAHKRSVKRNKKNIICQYYLAELRFHYYACRRDVLVQKDL